MAEATATAVQAFTLKPPNSTMPLQLADGSSPFKETLQVAAELQIWLPFMPPTRRPLKNP